MMICYSNKKKLLVENMFGWNKMFKYQKFRAVKIAINVHKDKTKINGQNCGMKSF